MIFDPAVPRRDELLRGEPVYVKYRVGESLRVVYRRDDTWRRRPHRAATAPSRASPSPTTASWTWRRSTACSTRQPPPVSSRGRPSSPPRSSATTPRDGWSPTPGCSGTLHPGRHSTPSARRACSRPAKDALLLEPIEGVRLDDLDEGQTRAAFAALGARRRPRALGVTREPDAARPQAASRASRALDPTRLVTAAEVIGRVRPDAAPAAQRLLARLLERRPRVRARADPRRRQPAQRAPARRRRRRAARSRGPQPRAGRGRSRAAARRRGVPAAPLLRGYGADARGAALAHGGVDPRAAGAARAISRHRPGARRCALLDRATARRCAA